MFLSRWVPLHWMYPLPPIKVVTVLCTVSCFTCFSFVSSFLSCSWVRVAVLVLVELLVLVEIHDDSLVLESEAQEAVLEMLGEVL